MIENLLKNCAIGVFDEKDKKYCERYSSSYPVFLVENPEVERLPIATLLIGWKHVSKLFPKQKITDRKINDNLYWTFSKDDGIHFSENEIETFIQRSMNNFFNIETFTYDALKDGEFRLFIRTYLKKDKVNYVYFYKNCLYIFVTKLDDEPSKILCINTESIEYVSGDSKSIITELIDKFKCVPFSYKNMNGYVDFDLMKKNILTVENIYWTKYNYELDLEEIKRLYPKKDINRFIPYLSMLITNVELSNEEGRSCIRLAERDIITIWLSSRKVFFDKNYKPSPEVKIKWHNYKKYTVPEYSDKRVMTGRINCVSKFNPQMLPKDSPIRKSIVSRFYNGKIVVFDYISFESKLSLYFSRDNDFINKFKDSDLHLEIAKVIFQSEKVTEEQRKIGKDINHTIMYGGGDKRLLEKMSIVPKKEEALERVKVFLSPILATSKIVNDNFKEIGYVINNFKTIIRPTKGFAAYNNYIQSTASEIVVDKLDEIKNWLKDKKSKFMYQTHDSFTFDFDPSEVHLIEEMQKLLSEFKGFYFPVEYKIGNNLADCTK